MASVAGVAGQTSPIPNANTVAAAAGYFIDQKKGEVNELKQVSNSVLTTNFESMA